MAAEAPTDPGRLLYAVRPTPSLPALAIGAAVLVALGVLTYLTNDRSAILAWCAMGGAAIVMGAATAAGFLDRHRVHEHAVVLGPTWPGATPYVVAISSIDPDSVTVHSRAHRVARRLNAVGMPTIRMAVYSTRAVSFRGASFDAAGGGRSAARRTGLEALRAAASGQRLPREATSVWVLGVRRPRPLLDALEAAFAADGRPCPGLADAAQARAVVEPPGRSVG